MALLRLNSPLLWAAALLSAAAAIACGAAVQESMKRAAPSTAPLPLVTKLNAGTVSSGDLASPPAAIDLTQFRPLLAQAELSDVALAMSEADYLGAAIKLKQHIVRLPSEDAMQQARFYYLLGSIYGKGDATEEARRAYERAGKLGDESSWLVTDEAHENAARFTLALERPADAILELERISDKDRSDVIELRALCLEQLSQPVEAQAEWARLIAIAPLGSEESHRAYLGQAQSLWAMAGTEVSGESLKKQAIDSLFRAQLGALPKSEIYQKAEVLRGVWNAVPPEESNETRVAGLAELVERRAFDEALVMSEALVLSKEEATGPLGCKLGYLRGKILAGQRKWGEAADRLGASLPQCDADPQLHASMLFNAGKYAAADGRDSVAVRYYEELETRYKSNSLADDARLRRAKSYKDMGSQAQFVALLSQMPEDYPTGDMTMEGVLLLAMEQMISHKWSEAASVLERASVLVRQGDSARGPEYAGTERYFLARCLMELGEEERALSEYESLIIEVPLSYYMLHAYSRLLEEDQKRARKALDLALERAKSAPFQFPYRPEYETKQFQRAMELLMVGELDRGRLALQSMSCGNEVDVSLLWGIALLFDRAGDAHYAHQLARGRLTDWLSQYPEGDWLSPWEIGFPRPYLPVVERQSELTGVDPWLIYGIMREESTFVPDIVSEANAYGLMQVIAPTARGIGKKFGLSHSIEALKQPRHNIAIGSRVLSELSRRFVKNPLLAIPGYNAGPSRPGRWLSERPNMDFDLWVESIPFRETRRYTKRVLASRAAYAFTYYRNVSDAALVLPKRLNLN